MRMGTGERAARGGAIVAAWMVLAAGIAPARAIMTPDCLAKKLQAWGNLRQCQRNAEAKFVQGRAADRAACQARFATTLDAISAQAAASAIPCRYHDNGDNTVTDFDTGLMWAKQHALDGFTNVFRRPRRRQHVHAGLCGGGGRVPHWHEHERHHDHPGARDRRAHRLALAHDPRAATIVDTTTVACQVGGPCIDPIFGLTAPGFYWASTTEDGSTGLLVDFQTGALFDGNPGFAAHARPVRSAF